MYALTTDLKRGHEFEGEQGGVYGRVWRVEQEVESVLVKTVSKASKQHSCEKEREKGLESYYTWTCTSENYFFSFALVPKTCCSIFIFLNKNLSPRLSMPL